MSTTYFQALGKLISDARKKAGLTQKELAYRVGSQKSHISEYENGKIKVSPKTLAKIVEVLGLDLDTINGEVQSRESIDKMVAESQKLEIT